MYKKLKIDYELSKKVYEEYKNVIKIKSCYYNVAMIIAPANIEILRDLKICFGAWQVPLSDNDSNLFAKHCFFLKGDDIVDPSYFASGKNDNIDYMIFKTLTVDEYLEYLIKDNFDASLPAVTNQMFNQATIELMKENIILVG